MAGGWMALGIPAYRLPRKILETEIDVIQKTGVEIKLNTPISKDGLTIENLWDQGYKAIYIAVGAHKSSKLDIPNEGIAGVIDGASWLKDLNLGKDVKVGKNVVVVGGGNVAIDSARTALRLGAQDVTIAYRRTIEEMPAVRDEIEQAKEEGIHFNFLISPYKIVCNNNVCTGIECFEMVLGEPDATGRKTPRYIAGSEFEIKADMVISAVGQSPDLGFLPDDVKLQLWLGGRIATDNNMATNIQGIFAGGDAVTGPASVIDAVAAAKKAAVAIDCYLTGKLYPAEKPVAQLADMDDPLMKFHLREVEKEDRAVMPILDVEDRRSSFKEVNLGLSKEEAIREARRCLTCRISSMRY